MVEVPGGQVAGVHHRRVGTVVVTALSDGYLTGSMAVIRGIGEEEAGGMLRAAFRPVPRQTAVNCFLIRAEGRVALVDTGSGPFMQDTAGKLFENMAAAGVAPEEVDTVLLTHMHPDHSNGLADKEGRARFPKAVIRMHEAELAYWRDAGAEAVAKETGQGVPYFAMAATQLAPYPAERIETFTGGEEVFPGVEAVHLPGHTPGHTGYRVASGGEALLIWGDIVHLPEIQVEKPEVGMQFDVDRGLARRTREAILAEVAGDRRLVAGMHLHFPGYGHVARDGAGGYRLVGEPWRLPM